jgi:hypothetical protein
MPLQESGRVLFPVRCVAEFDSALNLWTSRFEGKYVRTSSALGQALCGAVWEDGAEHLVQVADAPALCTVVSGNDARIEITSDVFEKAGLSFRDGKVAGPEQTVRGAIGLLQMVKAWANEQIATGDGSQALSAALDVWLSKDRDLQRDILAVLETPGLDAGRIFVRFLRGVGDDGARVQNGESARQWRRRWTTWLLGQARVDLPYDRFSVESILHTSADPDETRLLLYQAVRGYDRSMERRNAVRVASEVSWAGEELLFGRMSRAFHNQALLFANARYVTVTETLAGLVRALAVSASRWAVLRPAADRVTLLAPIGCEVAFTEFAGAIDHLEDATAREQRRRTQKALKTRRDEQEFAGDEKNHRDALNTVYDEGSDILEASAALRRELACAPRRPAAYVVISQRPSPTGSHLLAKINQGLDPFLGKPENLRRLVREAGDRVYASPDYTWLEHANHWVEAIPLFIKERIRIIDGVETAETVIDQDGMEESFREQMADHWARNIALTELSGYAALARALVFGEEPEKSDISRDVDRNRARRVKTENRVDDTARITVVIAISAQDEARAISVLNESKGDRLDAAREVLTGESCRSALWKSTQAFRNAGSDWSAAASLALSEGPEESRAQAELLLDDARTLAVLPRRPLPVLHVLTTQSARMTDGYIRTWLEESMALAGVVSAHGLGDAVKKRMADYEREIERIGESLVAELGLEVEIETVIAAEGTSRASAIRRVVGANRILTRQLSLIAVLREQCGIVAGGRQTALDPDEVSKYVELYRAELESLAVVDVVDRNSEEIGRKLANHGDVGERPDPQESERRVVAKDPEYRSDLNAFVRFHAREKLFREWDAVYPEWKLPERRDTWLRRHQRLALTTARKEIVFERGLAHLTLDPRFYAQAVGGNKRYHLIYTPSRVDLGPKERESVETWSQWVGGRDRQAAQVGKRVYGLINKSVKRFDSLTEPEVLKTGENASMAAHFAYSNAMALMVNATGRGDVEELGDEMSLREDRRIHPAGEGYGGYCVPKDGLFLEFVLTLSERVKLRQLGVEERFHDSVLELARNVLIKREDFASGLEWEGWAESLLSGADGLGCVYEARETKNQDGTPVLVPVFQITRMAAVLNELGQPPLREHRAVVKSLAARWGIHTMIAGAEHVNRFMPFYKAWLTYDALAEARRRDALVAAPDESVVVLSAEYKPDTQDGRFSVGMRKYEILAGFGDHLRYSLGLEASVMVALMFEGWEKVAAVRGQTDGELRKIATYWGATPDTASGTLMSVFPGFPPPAEIRLVSPMGLSTQDVLRYTSDTRIEDIAGEVQAALRNSGLSDDDIRGYMVAFGPRVERWTKLRGKPGTRELSRRIGGKIHALALASLGPDRSYEHALQGADVFDVGIPHRQVMELLSEPAKVCDLMLYGRPNSALVIVDGASGARRRALSRLGVMAWFAAAEQRGRQGVYRCIGLGEESVEDWRRNMQEHRSRAAAYQAALLAEDPSLHALFQGILVEVRDDQEALLALEEEERLQRFSRDTARDHAVAQLLSEIAGMRSPQFLTFAHWLALGGMFAIAGCAPSEWEEAFVAYERARARYDRSGTVGGAPARHGSEIRALALEVARPLERSYGTSFRQVVGIESSNKATEEVTKIALNTRRQLADRACKMVGLRARSEEFSATYGGNNRTSKSIDETIDLARVRLGAPEEFVSDGGFGALIALTLVLGEALVAAVYDADEEEAADVKRRLAALLNGSEFGAVALRAVCGGYEDIGAIARLAQTAGERADREGWGVDKKAELLDQIATLAEFVDTAYALDATLAERQRDPEEVDARALWRRIAEFFAETVNDHFYEYRPWAYSRGTGFEEYRGDALYALANRHYAWLYGYLRALATTRTEMRLLSAIQQDLLLGRIAGGTTIVAIGAMGETEEECRWRAYNQIREIAFIRNDGFELPPTFDEFDPALIDADNRVNILSMHPVGRTHVSRLLAEGPTLARELVIDGQPSANIILTRRARIDGNCVFVDDAHFYVDKATYVAALRQHWGLSESGAKALASRDVGPKGIRVAARFSRPVQAAIVLPMHGNPVYADGHLERLGLPYSVQARFHTWTTYDKAKYTDIFTPDTGVRIPAEIDWLEEWTASTEEAEVRQQMRNGRPGSDYVGLDNFSKKHRIVMLKDAAESGGRGQKAFALRSAAGETDENVMLEAIDFLFQVSLVHNVGSATAN